MARRPRLSQGLTIGGEQAEADPFHGDAFVENPLYVALESRHDPRCFVVGRTGSGKSAMLQHLEEQHGEHVVRISPEDLSLPYITDLQVIKYLDSLNVKLDLFWIALWKHVLIVEIIRRRYKIDSAEAKQRFLSGLREKFLKDPGKEAALAYLDEFEGRFWVEADERVKQITNSFTERLENEVDLSLGLPKGGARVGAHAGSAGEVGTETRVQVADRFQRIVNETQLARLNKMVSILDEEILDSAHFTYVIIDDLDRDWVDERISNDLIRCLFRTVLDLQRVRNLKAVVALRTNMFQELDFGRSGGQEEKFRSLVLDVTWNRRGLEEVLDERVRLAASRSGLDAQSMRELLPHANKARGNPLKYLLDRTLMRPRDAIAFANECLSKAAGATSISWDNIRAAERQYSSKRLLALRDEWKPTYPGIDALFEKFRGAPTTMSREQFLQRLDECLLLVGDNEFSGVRWITEKASAFWFDATPPKEWIEKHQPLVALLYRIGLIGCGVAGSGAPVFHADDPSLAESLPRLARCDRFVVHRTFQMALDIDPANVEDRRGPAPRLVQ
jgi:hypothetical protein